MRRTRRFERPGALRARPKLAVRGFDPNHLPHGCPLDGLFSCFFNNLSTVSRPGAGTGAGVFSRSSATAAAHRRTVSASSMGTCSKYVFLLRIAAAPGAACNAAVFNSYGENLLYVLALTQRPLRGSPMALARPSRFPVDGVGRRGYVYLRIFLLYVALRLWQ